MARLAVVPAVAGAMAFPTVAATADGPVLKPRLTMTKAASARTLVAGRPLTYTITIRNVGKVPARKVRLVDSMPRHVLVLRTSNKHCRASRHRVVCTWPRIGYHKSVRVAIKARIARTIERRTTLVNRARLAYAGRRVTAAVTVVALPSPSRPAHAPAHAPDSARQDRPNRRTGFAHSDVETAPTPAAPPAPVTPRPDRPTRHANCASGRPGAGAAHATGDSRPPNCEHRHIAGPLPHTGGPIAWLAGLALLSLAVGVLAVAGRLRNLRTGR